MTLSHLMDNLSEGEPIKGELAHGASDIGLYINIIVTLSVYQSYCSYWFFHQPLQVTVTCSSDPLHNVLFYI